jgi:hypothetical protein
VQLLCCIRARALRGLTAAVLVSKLAACGGSSDGGSAPATPLSITSSSLAAAQVQSGYSETLMASGGTSPYAWGVSSATLPPGLSLNASSGQITGTPTLSGSFSFTVQVTDSTMPAPQSATRALTLSVKAIPASEVSVILGAEQNVIAPGSPALQYTPDEHFSFQRQTDDTFKLWVSGGGSYGTYGFTSPDLFTLTSMNTSNGVPVGVLLPSGAGTPAFDADYAGAGSVFRAADGKDLLMIYHAENHLFSGVDYPGAPFYAGIGLARSQDGGLTWQRQGEIISGLDPQQPTQVATGAGALTPAAIESNGYIYVIYREIDLQSNLKGFAIARAPIPEDAAPGTWHKYYQGAFSTTGLGGNFTPLAIVLDPTVSADRRQPNVSFNSYLGSFVLIAVGNGGIYLATSPDLIQWSAGEVILSAPVPDSTVTPSSEPYNWYPTLVSTDQTSEQATSQTGYLYYAKGLGNGNSYHYMYRRSYTLSH